MKELNKENLKLELHEFLDFDKNFKKEEQDVNLLIKEAEKIFLIDENVPFFINDIYERKDLFYFVFKSDSEFMNCLYIGKKL
nr:hypothetical protein [uncultured Flavobacterium sp.]